MQETWVQSLGQEDPLEKEMATHSSILAWRVQWTEEPGGLQSMGSPRVGQDRVTSLSLSVLLPSLFRPQKPEWQRLWKHEGTSGEQKDRRVDRLETNAKSTRNTFKPCGRGPVSNRHWFLCVPGIGGRGTQSSQHMWRGTPVKLKGGIYLSLGPDICHQSPRRFCGKLRCGTGCSWLWQPLHPARRRLSGTSALTLLWA